MGRVEGEAQVVVSVFDLAAPRADPRYLSHVGRRWAVAKCQDDGTFRIQNLPARAFALIPQRRPRDSAAWSSSRELHDPWPWIVDVPPGGEAEVDIDLDAGSTAR